MACRILQQTWTATTRPNWLPASKTRIARSQQSPMASPPRRADKDWYNSSDREGGGDLRDVDVAAGNFDRAVAADGTEDDEIVVAFRDDFQDLHLKLLDGTNDGIIANVHDDATSDMFFDSNERGNIYHTAVATGDLNGDGFNNEFVTAFKDSGKQPAGDGLQPPARWHDQNALHLRLVFRRPEIRHNSRRGMRDLTNPVSETGALLT